MTWAVGAGIINGRGENALDPSGSAARVEAAAIFQRAVQHMQQHT